MKIQLLSDIHIEFGFRTIAKTDADVIVLAGDIYLGEKAIRWIGEEAQEHQKPLIFVAGNHEFYKGEYHQVIDDMSRAAAQYEHVHFLNTDELVIDGVRFLGCTLWTDYMAYTEVPRYMNMREVESVLNDHKVIWFNDRKLLASDLLEIHEKERAWLNKKLDEQFDGKTVVVTHHGPTLQASHPEFKMNSISTAFISDCESLVQKADFWCYGHTHSNLDVQIGKCRVMSNQHGYPREEVEGFDPKFTFCVEN